MEAWEKATKKYVEKWRNDKNVSAVFITGSRVTSFATKYSDVDIYVVLKEGTKWRERGNDLFDGFIMEYFMNTPSKIKKYLDEDFKENKRTMARMIMMSQLVFDNDGVVDKLKKLSIKSFEKRFAGLSKEETEINKYGVWDTLDNARQTFETSPEDFDFVYSIAVKKIIDAYLRFLGSELLPENKIVKAMTNEKFRREYHIIEISDKEFEQKSLECIGAHDKEAKLKALESLSYYILKAMGGFNIDGWYLRTKT